MDILQLGKVVLCHRCVHVIFNLDVYISDYLPILRLVVAFVVHCLSFEVLCYCFVVLQTNQNK